MQRSLSVLSLRGKICTSYIKASSLEQNQNAISASQRKGQNMWSLGNKFPTDETETVSFIMTEMTTVVWKERTN